MLIRTIDDNSPASAGAPGEPGGRHALLRRRAEGRLGTASGNPKTHPQPRLRDLPSWKTQRTKHGKTKDRLVTGIGGWG